MTSEPINVIAHLTLRPEGEPPERFSERGQLRQKEDKLLLQTKERRIQLEAGRVLLRQGYALELCLGRETPLDYPTPYGVLAMLVKTEQLELSADLRQVRAVYSLYSAGQRLHGMEMNLNIETEK